MWIYEHQGWPAFSWDASAISTQLALVRHHQGRLLGKMEGFGFELKQEASLSMITADVLKSSAIEGEILKPEDVRSSIARRLGLDVGGIAPSSRDVEGVVEMMLDATQNFRAPLTLDRLLGWHASLFPTGRSGMHRITVGALRTGDVGPMQVVSGPIGREKIHYESPSASILEHELMMFLDWINK